VWFALKRAGFGIQGRTILWAPPLLVGSQQVDFQDFVFQLVEFQLWGFQLEAESAELS
jgi:hypothetical protein